MAGAEVRSVVEGITNRGRHLRVVVAQQEGSVASDVVDVLVAIDIPLVRPLRSVNVDPVWPEVPSVVRDATREKLLGLAGETLRAGVFFRYAAAILESSNVASLIANTPSGDLRALWRERSEAARHRPNRG